MAGGATESGSRYGPATGPRLTIAARAAMIGANFSDSLATDSNKDNCCNRLAEVGTAVARDKYGEMSAVDEDLREVGEVGDTAEGETVEAVVEGGRGGTTQEGTTEGPTGEEATKGILVWIGLGIRWSAWVVDPFTVGRAMVGGATGNEVEESGWGWEGFKFDGSEDWL
jgi:hypothetical protein